MPMAYRGLVARPEDPILRTARWLAVALTVFDTGLGLATTRRPELVRRAFDDEATGGEDRFVRRWGMTIYGYAGIHALTALFPGPATFGASASLRAVEAPADLVASSRVRSPERYLLQAASAFNTAATIIFAAGALRSRHRAD